MITGGVCSHTTTLMFLHKKVRVFKKRSFGKNLKGKRKRIIRVCRRRSETRSNLVCPKNIRPMNKQKRQSVTSNLLSVTYTKRKKVDYVTYRISSMGSVQIYSFPSLFIRTMILIKLCNRVK